MADTSKEPWKVVTFTSDEDIDKHVYALWREGLEFPQYPTFNPEEAQREADARNKLLGL